MRNRQLHAALAAFAEEAAFQLASDAADGAELPFEVVELSGSRREAPLYCYRPLTADFIDERLSILGRLTSFAPAVHALAACGGLDSYLVARGEHGFPAQPRARAEGALRHFLTRVFEEQTDFELTPDRLARAYEELESIVMEGRALTEVVAPILGLALMTDEIPLGEGLSLTRSGAPCLDDAPADATRPRDDGHQVVLARLTWEAAPGDEAPLRHAQVRHPSAFLQHAYAMFLSLGHHESHARRVNAIVQERLARAADALQRHLPDFRFTPPQGGASLWVEGPDWLDSAELADVARGHGVLIEAGRVFYDQPPYPCPQFRMRLSSISGAQIDAGVRALALAVQELAAARGIRRSGAGLVH